MGRAWSSWAAIRTRWCWGRPPDAKALLEGAADAARCPGLGALIVECWGKCPALDLTASRRLALAAEQSGVTLLLLRLEAEPVPSAADTRWAVSAAPEPGAGGQCAGAADVRNRIAAPARRAFGHALAPGVGS